MKPIKLILKPLFFTPIYLLKHNQTEIIDKDDYDHMDLISNSDNIKIDIPVVFTIRESYIFPQYNIKHPLTNFLFTSDPKSKILLSKLTIDIRKILDSHIEALKNSDNVDLIKLANKNNSVILKGIFKRDVNLYSEFEKLFTNLWVEAKEAELIKSSKIRPKLKKSDFPWFWFD